MDSDDNQLSINGTLTEFSDGDSFDLGSGTLTYQVADNDPSFILNYSDGEELIIERESVADGGLVHYFDVDFTAVSEGDEFAGLLGNNDGDPSNDLALRDGTVLDPSTSSQELRGEFSESWRVSSADSLFMRGQTAHSLNINNGSDGNDVLNGTDTDDVLSGQQGNDVLDGGAGNDTLNGGQGIDTAVYQFAPAAVTVTLDEGDIPGTASDGFGGTDSITEIENIIGSEFDDILTGNSGNNSLTGRGGNDAIAGGAGNDMLVGSSGADTISGGAGSDNFMYLSPDEGGDTISDFAVGTDKIMAVSAAFGGGLSAGVLPEGSFVTGSAATNDAQRFIFDNTSGELFFDIDGSGIQSQQTIATLTGVSNLSSADIQLL